ncbi:MAG: tetratricopeptide repeat protein, partial [Candidatus Omnitrophota bacterium]
AYLGLGFIYRSQGKFPQVEDLFKKALELNPKNDRAYGAISALYEEIGKAELAKEFANKANRLRLEYSVTVNNYRKLKEILDKRGIKLVCVQYPMRSIDPLKKIFEKDEGVIFVDNETIFKEMVKKSGPKEVFLDMFGGDFGHCTPKGNRLLAQNIADAILRAVFNK